MIGCWRSKGATPSSGEPGVGAVSADLQRGREWWCRGRSTDSLAAAVAALGELQATGMAADNADPASPERLVAAALDRWGRLDGAVLNGGGPPVGSVATLSDDAWRHSFESVSSGWSGRRE
ncbi:SDR family NAD(P)-dependent oxidoreductase [Nonomuraea jabiensis]|uniref:SDR family NAD(P)-dependent oxidoreductase n=1 Tax=Nonomuraea jabiensis TaxID=882448 RepID=UPI003D709226